MSNNLILNVNKCSYITFSWKKYTISYGFNNGLKLVKQTKNLVKEAVQKNLNFYFIFVPQEIWFFLSTPYNRIVTLELIFFKTSTECIYQKSTKLFFFLLYFETSSLSKKWIMLTFAVDFSQSFFFFVVFDSIKKFKYIKIKRNIKRMINKKKRKRKKRKE